MEKSSLSTLAAAEEAQLAVWAKQHTFERSVQQREGAEPYIFYDGPPFANGMPHLGHMLTSTLKDAVTRYKTMRGYYVPRRFGWDCHGLPPEMLAEKELGISGKKAIESYGIDKFVGYCRDSVLRFTAEWHEYVTRLGRWVDFADDYRTMDVDYMESVLWAFKTLYEKGLIYEGERVVPYSYGAQTSLSISETRLDDSMRDREDLTATIRFALADGRHLLGWTTTPWTLPANLLLAVHESLDYVEMGREGETVVLAAEALERYTAELTGWQQQRRFKGSELVGLTYEPLFPYFVGTENAFRVVAADFVEAGEGTGVVHIAPGHGEDDYWLGKAEQVAILSPVDDEGRFTAEVKDYVGRLVFDANNEIVADLDHQHKLFAKAIITHKYPHCWRTDVPIIYRALSAWFVDVPKIKDQLLKANQEIHWFPAHIKDGAFGKWLENAREWNISRNRYWGAPLPVWKTDDGEIMVMGSLEEIRERAVKPELVTDLHRPNIDVVELKTDSGKIAHRIGDVFDCWFESGSMPFAQLHYPFENKEQFESTYPADFITEYVGQTRGWFYNLHVMSVALFGKPAFKNAVAHGILLGNDGRKLSKRLGNYPENSETFDQFGADAIRFYLLSTPLVSGDTAAYDSKSLQEAQRNVIQRFKNVHSFYAMYAEVDAYQPNKQLTQPKSDHPLDQWVLARLSQTVTQVSEAADSFDTPRLCRSLSEYLDDVSNWYVRRSRRRFWKSGDDTDKQTAFATLHYVLATTAQLMAPWAPFVADEIWQAVMSTTDEAKSVHLSDWPQASEPDMGTINKMAIVREAVTLGLAERASAGIKVRQPLASATIQATEKLSTALTEIIAEELNVKMVKFKFNPTNANGEDSAATVTLDTKLNSDLKAEGVARDIIRFVQAARKSAGLQVDDRIELALVGGEQLTSALAAHQELICEETLATEFMTAPTDRQTVSTVQLNGEELTIGLAVRKG
ncbi:MAG: isoleucine--tRNA ligase [Candidatus Saccharibacteria bacterium]